MLLPPLSLVSHARLTLSPSQFAATVSVGTPGQSVCAYLFFVASSLPPFTPFSPLLLQPPVAALTSASCSLFSRPFSQPSSSTLLPPTSSSRMVSSSFSVLTLHFLILIPLSLGYSSIKSSTYKLQQDNVTFSFFTGATSGSIASDTVSIGGASVKQYFGNAASLPGAQDGILGLGFADKAKVRFFRSLLLPLPSFLTDFRFQRRSPTSRLSSTTSSLRAKSRRRSSASSSLVSQGAPRASSLSAGPTRPFTLGRALVFLSAA
jgi:hypothetical protein